MLISKNLMMIKTTLQINNDEDEEENKEINILLFYY